MELLGNNISSDPGLTDILLRYAWEGIAWVKASIADALQTALPYLQNISPSPFLQDVQRIVSSALIPSSRQDFALNTKVTALESSLAAHLPRVANLYSVYSGWVSKQPTEVLASRLNSITQQLSVLENHVASTTPIFGLGHQLVSPLLSPSSSELGAVKAQVLHLEQK